MLAEKPTFPVALKLAARHLCLPVERVGDTLVVTPAGDLTSFSRTLVSAELKRVQELLGALDVNHVLFDLGNARYFGAEAIGLFLQMKQSLRPEGRLVFCETSRDMKTLFEHLQVNQVVEVSDSRRETLSRLARVSFSERAARWYRIALLLGIVALFLGAYWTATQTNVLARWIDTPEMRGYRRVSVAYQDLATFLSLPRNRAREGEYSWDLVKARLNEQCQPVKTRFWHGEQSRPDHRQLGLAAHLLLQCATLDSPPPATRLETIESELELAREKIEQRTGVPLEPPTSKVADETSSSGDGASVTVADRAGR
jgi:anti-anti-sigma regulatory factor